MMDWDIKKAWGKVRKTGDSLSRVGAIIMDNKAVAFKCAIAGAMSSVALPFDSISDFGRILTKPATGQGAQGEYAEALGKGVATFLGVGEKDLAADPDPIKAANKEAACSLGTAVGAIGGGMAVTVVAAGATAGAGTAPVLALNVTRAQQAFKLAAAAITITEAAATADMVASVPKLVKTTADAALELGQ